MVDLDEIFRLTKILRGFICGGEPNMDSAYVSDMI